MTILEELIEFALVACERGRASVVGVAAVAALSHSGCRGAAALGPDGKVAWDICIKSADDCTLF